VRDDVVLKELGFACGAVEAILASIQILEIAENILKSNIETVFSQVLKQSCLKTRMQPMTEI
jgi:hypothetical protein